MTEMTTATQRVTIDHDIVGNAMQMVVCRLAPGQTMFAEAGKFLFKESAVVMDTRFTQPSNRDGNPGGAKGFLQNALDAGKRMLAGESFAFQEFTYQGGGSGLVALAGVLPGEVRALEIQPGEEWTTEKDAFVGAAGSVKFDIAFSGLKNGLFGGEGLVLEKFTSQVGGTLFIAGAGNFIDLNPADFGGKLQVDTGCIVAFESNKIRYNVQAVGGLNRKGIASALFGGEGLTLATLEGNGRVILQSMTMGGLATALSKNAAFANLRGDSNGNQVGLGGLAGMAGGGAGVLGGLLGGGNRD